MADTIEATGLIKAPVEKVFSYVTNLSNLPRWVGAINAVEGVSAAGGVGATAAVTAHIVNKDVRTSLKVTEHQKNQKFSYEFSDEPYGGGFQFSFQPVFGDHTKVTMSMVVGEKNVFKSQAEAMLRNLNASLESLKENIEAS